MAGGVLRELKRKTFFKIKKDVKKEIKRFWGKLKLGKEDLTYR